jgi:hypothetical protein
VTEEERAWLAAAVAKGLDWISPAEAEEIIRAHLNCKMGKSKAMLQEVCTATPSEVRSCNDDPQKRWEKTWCVCKSDLEDWLGRQRLPASTQQQSPATRQPVHRYAGDAALIEEGRKLITGGMSARKAARGLAPRAEGGTIEQREERLRKLLRG